MFFTIIIEVAVSFESEVYKGCSTRGDAIEVTLKASRNASLPYSAIVWPMELPSNECNRAIVNVDFSCDHVVIRFNPGETEQSGNVTLLESNPYKGAALKCFSLTLVIPAKNEVAVNLSQQQYSIAAITCQTG